VNRRLIFGSIAVALLLLSGAAQAQCEDMVVIVRNSIYQINGLDAFCKEFNKMKADLASMKSALSNARQENAMLRGRLDVGAAHSRDLGVARLEPTRAPRETGTASQ
jgi:hypothetical protein